MSNYYVLLVNALTRHSKLCLNKLIHIYNLLDSRYELSINKILLMLIYSLPTTSMMHKIFCAIPIAQIELEQAGIRVYPHEVTNSYLAWIFAYITFNIVAYYVGLPLIVLLFPRAKSGNNNQVVADNSKYLPLKIIRELAAKKQLYTVTDGAVLNLPVSQVNNLPEDLKRVVSGSISNQKEILISDLNWYFIYNEKITPIQEFVVNAHTPTL